MSGLPHPLLEMREVHFRMVGGKPDKIIPVPSLDPAFPFAAECGVHFAGKEIGQTERPDCEGNREKQVFGGCCKPGGRIGIGFQFDVQLLIPGDLLNEALVKFDRDHLVSCVGFEKSGLYGRRRRFFRGATARA